MAAHLGREGVSGIYNGPHALSPKKITQSVHPTKPANSHQTAWQNRIFRYPGKGENGVISFIGAKFLSQLAGLGSAPKNQDAHGIGSFIGAGR
ncbi:hypothetical protein AA100600_0856 [Gluconobacter thailandicus F149-1 = NBRC 100600]|nr:hypothetical protein AA100600_0856 [Gluconobacter thailandicus F149-1 = NBRC 100600]